jgi:hypothetical protein
MPQFSGMSAQSNQQTAYKKDRFNSVLLLFSSVSAHKKVSLNSILLQFSRRLQDQARVNDVTPQSSGVSAQSNQGTAYKKVRFVSVLPRFSGMSAHKEVSLDSILPQFSGGSQDQARVTNVTPQCSGVSVQSNQQTAYRKRQIRQYLAAVQRRVSTQGS